MLIKKDIREYKYLVNRKGNIEDMNPSDLTNTELRAYRQVIQKKCTSCNKIKSGWNYLTEDISKFRDVCNVCIKKKEEIELVMNVLKGMDI